MFMYSISSSVQFELGTVYSCVVVWKVTSYGGVCVEFHHFTEPDGSPPVKVFIVHFCILATLLGMNQCKYSLTVCVLAGSLCPVANHVFLWYFLSGRGVVAI